VRDKLYIETTPGNAELIFTIISPDGRVQISGKANRETRLIPVNALLPGIYFLKLSDKRAVKFIKF
jgi:hypothetical protein